MSDGPENETIRREFDTDGENPAVQVAEAIADLEGKEPIELATIYDCIGGMLDELFSEPPSPETRMKVEFNYERYRITVEQNGRAEFVKTT